MRSLVVVVTLFVTVNSHAVPAQDDSTEPLLSNHGKDQSEQFVLDLAGNFSSFFFERMTDYVSKDEIVSPLNVLIPMAMLSYGARGDTMNNMLDAILFRRSKTEMAKHGLKMLLNKLAEHEVRIKTKMFLPAGVKMNACFVSLSTQVFNAENDTVDSIGGFMDSEKINKWVADQTNNNVMGFLEPRNQPFECTPPKTAYWVHLTQGVLQIVVFRALRGSFVLMTTVYFKASWEKAFDKSLTELHPFYAYGDYPADVLTMRMTGRIRYGRIQEIRASFFELPYKTKDMSMFVLLPDVVDNGEWTNLITNFVKMNSSRLLNSTEEEVELLLPKFKIATEQPLDEFFRMMFLHSDPSDFSGVFDSSAKSNLHESAAKLVIEIDEEGTEAAAASGICYNADRPRHVHRYVRSAPQEIRRIEVDHPFVVMIMMKGGGKLTNVFSVNIPGSKFAPERTII